jgi:hypothetical protein
MEKQIETQEIWVPCGSGEGQAVRFENGQHLMLAAITANGHPIYLANGIVLEKVWRPEPALKAMQQTSAPAVE